MAERNAGKQRRQAQNRAAREALAARKEAARARPARTVDEVAKATGKGARPARATAARSSADGRAAATGSAIRQRPPAKPGPPWLAKYGYDEPGGRFVIFGAAFTIISAIALLFIPIVPKGGLGKVAQRASEAAIRHGPNNIPPHLRTSILSDAKVHMERITSSSSGLALLVLGAPVLIALLTVLLAPEANRRRTWAIGAAAMFIIVMFSGGTGIFYLVAFGAMAWGAYTAYKTHREELIASGQLPDPRARARGTAGGRAGTRAGGRGGRGAAIPARGRELRRRQEEEEEPEDEYDELDEDEDLEADQSADEDAELEDEYDDELDEDEDFEDEDLEDEEAYAHDDEEELDDEELEAPQDELDEEQLQEPYDEDQLPEPAASERARGWLGRRRR